MKNLLTGHRIDGLLLQRAGVISDEVLASLTPAELPTVLLNDWTTGDISSVALDDFAAADLALDHLLALGHTAIAHLAGTESARTEQRRLGYEQRLAARGLPTRVAVGGWDIDSGREGMTRLLDSGSPPTAVFVANTLTAVGALVAIRDAGLRIPDDVSVISVHDVWFADHLSPPLTTIRMPLTAMGRRAVEILAEQIDGHPPQRVMINDPAPVLRIRSSTAAPPMAVRSSTSPMPSGS